MLRHPVERILSLYHFERLVEANYGEHQGLKMSTDTTVQSFVQTPPFTDVDNGQTRRISGCAPDTGRCDRAMLQQAKDNLRKHFAVIGLTERFDETLLLLKHAFDWTNDVFYYPRNTNPERSAVPRMPKEAVEMILKSNAFDYELYQFAVELMESAIVSYGASFQQDLDEYRRKRQAWYDEICIENARATHTR
jgi:hypothetical protein